MNCLLILAHAVLSVELVNTSARLGSFLLACIERMAFGTDFNVNVLVGRACYKCIATVTCYSCLMIIWMDSLFHVFHLTKFYHIMNTCLVSLSAIRQLLMK